MDVRLKPAHGLGGSIALPGDKSISHRALMIAAIAEGVSQVEGLGEGADLRSTMYCLRALGVKIVEKADRVLVHGKGLLGLQSPEKALDAGNSGTTIRLLSGILAGQRFTTTITGDESLRRRPMARIIEPLRQMGVVIQGDENDRAPLQIRGGRLKALRHRLPIPSAQVKSCILLAGLYAEGATTVVEPSQSRDHTERMLKHFGGSVKAHELEVTIEGFPTFQGQSLSIPGDISSAAFFLIAVSLVKNSKLVIKKVGINPTRTGILEILTQMGGQIKVENQAIISNEPRADIVVESADLKGLKIDGMMIPRVIDEIPVLAVAATQAHGETIIRDAQELRVKESDRIRATVNNLRRMGVQVEELPDGMRIQGPQPLRGTVVDSYGDHRIAMSFAIAALVAQGETILRNAQCVHISFPGFFNTLEKIRHD